MMKKSIFAVLLLFALVSCAEDATDPLNGNNGTAGNTTGNLTLRNNSSIDILLVSWYGNDGQAAYFTVRDIWSAILQEFVPGMAGGDSLSQTVTAGRSPFYFYFAAGGGKYETVSSVLVQPGRSASFSFTDETLVRQSTKRVSRVLRLRDISSKQ